MSTQRSCVLIIIQLLPQKITQNILKLSIIETSRGAEAQSVTVKATGCEFDTHSSKWNIYLNLNFNFFALELRQSAALSSANQHAMPLEFVA